MMFAFLLAASGDRATGAGFIGNGMI